MISSSVVTICSTTRSLFQIDHSLALNVLDKMCFTSLGYRSKLFLVKVKLCLTQPQLSIAGSSDANIASLGAGYVI
jgi:hypothetical protein